ncbi:DUF3967 domain-containing protein [Paenibacillus validus]|uniref:DUF3967 domain-containing protein n=1 Tax=Paenibacillus validus TaxID=44253 RepID=UPI003D2BDDBF
MKDDQAKSYWSHEVAKLLDISTSTLRKWSMALEAAGYAFLRDENDKRAYLERDIMPLQKMRELLSDGMGMENAAKAVVLRFAEQMSDSGTMVVRGQDERSSERYSELLQQNQELRNFLEQLAEGMKKEHAELRQELADQRRYIEESLKSRDELLMKALREMQDARQQAAAAKRWWKFWK